MGHEINVDKTYLVVIFVLCFDLFQRGGYLLSVLALPLYAVHIHIRAPMVYHFFRGHIGNRCNPGQSILSHRVEYVSWVVDFHAERTRPHHILLLVRPLVFILWEPVGEVVHL